VDPSVFPVWNSQPALVAIRSLCNQMPAHQSATAYKTLYTWRNRRKARSAPPYAAIAAASLVFRRMGISKCKRKRPPPLEIAVAGALRVSPVFHTISGNRIALLSLLGKLRIGRGCFPSSVTEKSRKIRFLRPVSMIRFRSAAIEHPPINIPMTLGDSLFAPAPFSWAFPAASFFRCCFLLSPS